MKEKTEKLLELAKELYGEESDFLIIAHKNNQCSAATHGDLDTIANSIFAAIHTSENLLAEDLYRLIKLNVENILNNPSPYSRNLIKTFNKTLQNDED